jgi:enoyl-[acyl-carrier protein] reductase II
VSRLGRRAGVLLLGAGGIADGAAVAAALRAGADGVWVGTRLIASEEAHVHPEYQRRLVESTAATVRTTAFGPEWPNQPYRMLATPLARRWAGREHEIPEADKTAAPIGHTTLFPHSANMPYNMPPFSSIPPTPDTSGDWEAIAYGAGEGVGAVRAVSPAAQIIAEMVADARAALDRRPSPTVVG